MAKTYLGTVKYNIVSTFEINGIVDKHDIVGAVFGQSEGLLGSEMDLKGLQQNGKIGRIEVDPKVVNGKTVGKIIVPSSMDMAQTALLAAAIETVDKVGPCESKFATESIEDTRSQKREVISNRAQELLSQFLSKQPESQELAEDLRSKIRTAKLVDYGPENLPAGPDIDANHELIVVEGRADVLNLLKHGITNVVGMDGSKVQASLAELCQHKVVTAFIDGDRGGDLNARTLRENTKVDFVAKAPDGKEVEELVQKEILLALRKKRPYEQVFPKEGTFSSQTREPVREMVREPYGDRGYGQRPPMRDSFGSRSGSMRNNRGGFENRSNRFGGRPMGNFRDDRGFRPRPMRNDFDQRPQWREVPNANNSQNESEYREAQPQTSASPSTGNELFSGFEVVSSSQPREIRSGFSGPRLSADEENKLKTTLHELKGSLSARLLDNSNSKLGETPVRGLVEKLAKTKDAKTIVLDGIITKRLVDAAAKTGVSKIVGVKRGKFENANPSVQLIVFNE